MACHLAATNGVNADLSAAKTSLGGHPSGFRGVTCKISHDNFFADYSDIERNRGFA